MLDPFPFLLVAVAGWRNWHQQQTIEYLREENRVLREQLGNRRLRFHDDQRRRLAARAKGLGCKLLSEAATLVTPDTVVLVNSNVIDKLGFGALPSIPFRPPLLSALRLSFRLASEPCCIAIGNPGAAPSARGSAALR